MTDRVFVYGTLKRGYGNHLRLLVRSKFVGSARSSENYMMRDVGFPIIWPDEEGAPVKGELFMVDDQTLKACDRLEGHPYMYRRERKLFMRLDTRLEELAWVYIWQGSERDGDPLERRKDGTFVWSTARGINAAAVGREFVKIDGSIEDLKDHCRGWDKKLREEAITAYRDGIAQLQQED